MNSSQDEHGGNRDLAKPGLRKSSIKERARAIKADTVALYLAYRDPRVPWYAKVWGALVILYALSPVDLIPDFIPVLGYVDDVVLLPLGIALAVRMIPTEVMDEYRQQAREYGNKPRSRLGGAIIVVIWLVAALLLGRWLWSLATSLTALR